MQKRAVPLKMILSAGQKKISSRFNISVTKALLSVYFSLHHINPKLIIAIKSLGKSKARVHL
jgi:hypothetical protein